MKAIVIGSINKDIVYNVNDIVKPGETISSSKVEYFLGGKGLNQAIALSNMTKNVFFYTIVNKYENEIINQLKRYNFDNSLIQYTEDKMGEAFIQVNDEGENAIVLAANSNHLFNVSKIYKVLDTFTKNDYVILQNEINDIDKIIKYAKEKELQVVLNPSPISDIINHELLLNVDYLIVNRTEFKAISNTHWAREGMRSFHKEYPHIKLVVTLGEEGVFYIDDSESYKIPSHEVEVSDTTCAGDTFLGYFIGSLMENNTVKESLYTATKASSICVGLPGASNSIPTKDQI